MTVRSTLVRLYPRRWRHRYGDEFAALLEDAPLSSRMVIDIVRGAIAAHFDPYPIDMEGHTVRATRWQAVGAVFAAVVCIPGLLFLWAAIFRTVGRVEQQPAVFAGQVFDWFSGNLGSSTLAVVLIALPAAGLVVAGAIAVIRYRMDAALRADIGVFAGALLRVLHRPAFVIAVLATVASLGLLGFGIVHAIAG